MVKTAGRHRRPACTVAEAVQRVEDAGADSAALIASQPVWQLLPGRLEHQPVARVTRSSMSAPAVKPCGGFVEDHAPVHTASACCAVRQNRTLTP